MLSLFYNIDKTEYPIRQDPKWLYIRHMYNEEVRKIIEYYSNRESRVKNDNLLVRIINTLDIDYTLEDMEYLERVESRSDFISKNFDIVSRKHYGSILKDEVFENSKEIFILNSNSAIDYIEEDYRSFKPLSLLEYRGNNLDLVPPSESVKFEDGNLTIFSININLLLLGYKYWALERIENEMSTNPSYYIYKFVLPKLLEDMIDFTIFNRLMSIFYYGNVVDNLESEKNPFIVRDMSNNIDKILKKVIKDMNNKPLDYKQLLEFIPGIIKENSYETLFLNNISFNRQVFWSYLVSRLREIEFILTISGSRGRKRNDKLVKELEIIIKQFERENIIDRVLDEDLKYEVEYQIENIKNILNYSR